MKRSHRIATATALSALALWSHAAGMKVGKQELGGVVMGPSGPEAGVWVIAETKDLPTKFAKVVVTDEKGRYLLPEMPSAQYQVWVRGYGLVDSEKVVARPGQQLDLKAVPAPDERAAAQYYPGMYWYSLMDIPKASDFPGTGEKGNGIPAHMKKQAYWVDTVKNACQSCHALGSEGMRKVPDMYKKMAGGDSFGAWAYRTQAGQAMAYMGISVGRLGPEKGLELFADWTDKIEKGAVPFAKPDRPKGVERNVVITMWDFLASRASKALKNSSCVRSLLAKNCTSSIRSRSSEW